MTSGRAGMGHRVYRRNRATMLATDSVCALCGHPGALSADHIITAKAWPRDAAGKMLPGYDDPANLQPAHGTMGAGRGRLNRCPICSKLCNQSRGARTPTPSPRSQDW